MNYQELMAKLQANAEAFVKPGFVDVDGIGRIYVRKRTVAEFEAMAEAKEGETNKFGIGLSRLLCDENGRRFSEEEQKALAEVLAIQPQEIFHKLIAASDGTKKEETKEAGN